MPASDLHVETEISDTDNSVGESTILSPRLVTFFEEITQTTGGKDMPLESIIEMIRSPKYKSACEKIQETTRKYGRDAAKKAKKKLLAYVTFSGQFEKRNDNGIVGSALSVHGDLDGQSLRELERIMAELLKSKYLEYLFVSPSGNGLKFGFRIPPTNTADEYKARWRALDHHIRRYHGVKLDSIVSDISHACFLSHDPNAYYNPDPEVFTNTRDEPKAAEPPHDEPSKPDVNTNGHMPDDELIRRMLTARNGEKARKLWNGDHSDYEQYDSQGTMVNDGESEGDAALCTILAYWCDKDPDRIERIFKQSKLYRPDRWAKADYAERTIRYAIGQCRETYSGKSKTGDSSIKDIPLSDIYNAKRLVQKYGGIIKYCGFWDKTFIYSNGIWEIDHNKSVVEFAKSVARDIHKEAQEYAAKVADSDDAETHKKADAFLKFAVSSHGRGKIQSMIELSMSDPAVSVSHKAFDTHHYLLPCINGVVNLRTGKLLPHDPKYLFTKQLPIVFDPSATCPIWDQTLLTVMGEPIAPDSPEYSEAFSKARDASRDRAKRLVRFLKESLGQALTGDISEHMLVIFWGRGRNGKGIILETLLELYGEYATKLTQGVLMQNRFEPHPTEFTDLFGRRFAITSETDKNRRLNLGLVKELTGGDTIKARRMREDFWEFSPTHHLFLSTNHKPTIEEDDAIWERIFLVPFERTFEHPSKLTDEQRKDPETPIRDMHLKDKLLKELPGILNWLVQGCLSWQENGLYIPEDVLAATKAYREEEDVIGRFLDEECSTGNVKGVTTPEATPKELFSRYKAWASESDEHERLSQKGFKDALEKRGYEQYHDGSKRYWHDMRLKANTQTEANKRCGD